MKKIVRGIAIFAAISLIARRVRAHSGMLAIGGGPSAAGCRANTRPNIRRFEPRPSTLV